MTTRTRKRPGNGKIRMAWCARCKCNVKITGPWHSSRYANHGYPTDCRNSGAPVPIRE